MAAVKENDVTVILRTVGERTTNLCRQLIEEQIPSENVIEISEVPFSKAVRRTFEIGVQRNLPWTLAVDADVLLARNSIQAMKTLANKYGESLYKFNPNMQDKFWRSTRFGGVHLYRTAHVARALTLFDQDVGEYIKPETHVAELVRDKYRLHSILFDKYTAGLHDYEQYYSDIYRKAFVFAHKHSLSSLTHFLQYWGQHVKIDNDYLVAFAGLCEGLAFRSKVEINIDKLPTAFTENRLCQSIHEKDPISKLPWQNGEDIRNFIEAYEFERTGTLLEIFRTRRNVLRRTAIITGSIVGKLGKKLLCWGSYR